MDKKTEAEIRKPIKTIREIKAEAEKGIWIIIADGKPIYKGYEPDRNYYLGGGSAQVFIPAFKTKYEAQRVITRLRRKWKGDEFEPLSYGYRKVLIIEETLDDTYTLPRGKKKNG